ncbi:MAG TPA: AraC family transcriptional regulator [Dinghuibacter sp.]|uniref:AraC family transcriptional regulator n=1 Tax=Dinghuibacter sp. TaxID=2024697 RepID=UPI002C3D7FEE|nr:AraC family transcriptional regulator [Dinghuibacter sp.]HTJ13198.1 AraC family transcriptional regulator [Dinghuibacter sp.]
MSTFHFTPVEPHPLLKPFIAKMWVFESTGRLPEMDNKLIVPNGNFKLAFTSRNGLTAHVGDGTFIQRENELSLTGIVDTKVLLNPMEDQMTETIGVELNPLGAYRLFRLNYTDVSNRIGEMEDLLGNATKMLKVQMAEANTTQQKTRLLQSFLLRQLENATPDPVYDYCVNKIYYEKGLVNIKQLEKETGYTTRWLHKKFMEHLGTGPKNLAEIIKFKQVYEAYANKGNLKDHIYDYYYDQSHFLRVFKRMTGFNPTDLQNSLNELATRHYTS